MEFDSSKDEKEINKIKEFCNLEIEVPALVLGDFLADIVGLASNEEEAERMIHHPFFESLQKTFMKTYTAKRIARSQLVEAIKETEAEIKELLDGKTEENLQPMKKLVLMTMKDQVKSMKESFDEVDKQIKEHEVKIEQAKAENKSVVVTHGEGKRSFVLDPKNRK